MAHTPPKRIPWTTEDIDRFFGALDPTLLPWQRDWLLVVLNADGPVIHAPRRHC